LVEGGNMARILGLATERGSITPVTPPPEMSAQDIRLLEIATDTAGSVWVQGRHEVATALRAADGKIYNRRSPGGLLPPQLDLCRRSCLGCRACGPEPGLALTHRHRGVSSDQTADQFRIIAPAGVCREFFSDYSPTRNLDHRRQGIIPSPP